MIESIKKYKSRSLICLGIIIYSLYLGNTSFQMNAVMIGMPINIGFVTIIWLAIRFNKPQEKKIGSFFTLTTCAIILALNIVSYNIQVYLLENRMSRLIQSINAYNQVNKTYPEKLSILIPNYIDEIPKCKSAPNTPLYHKNNDEFTLTCVTFAFLKHTYASTTNQWQSWD